MKPKAAVVVFPGTNCERETYRELERAGFEVRYLWHEEVGLSEYQLVVLPGGFSYGDYLRTGALAKFSPVSIELESYRGLILGICNGFQILTELGMLPGALLPNENGRFICDWVDIEVVDSESPFTIEVPAEKTLRIPVAHYRGRYVPGSFEPRVAFRYVNNPNGSWESVAGVLSEDGRILGMMPHPERASDALLGSEDGMLIFKSIIKFLRG